MDKQATPLSRTWGPQPLRKSTGKHHQFTPATDLGWKMPKKNLSVNRP